MTACSSRRHHIHKHRVALCVLALCAGMTACGQVGPLYLPGEDVQEERSDPSLIPVSIPEDDSDSEEGNDNPSDDQ